MKKIKAGIIGGAGYTGGEMIRILLNHPGVEISFINSISNADKLVSSVHPDLLGETDALFSDALHKVIENIDVLFLCIGHGEARTFLEQHTVGETVKIIDLSQDFRLQHTSTFGDRKFIYGLPELNKEAIKNANNIANPGCFATAIQVGLLPLAKEGILKEVYVTGITGSTGAGQSLNPTSHFSWRANNIQGYKTLTHQHLFEIHQSLHQLQSNFPGTPDESENKINFIPWRGDFTRGIFTSSTVSCDLFLEELMPLYKDYFKDHPFTQVSKDSIYLKQVVNTNKCVIGLEKVGTKLVVHTAIDNLTKGASGQAVQNMNLMFGFEETTGLNLKAAAF